MAMVLGLGRNGGSRRDHEEFANRAKNLGLILRMWGVGIHERLDRGVTESDFAWRVWKMECSGPR